MIMTSIKTVVCTHGFWSHGAGMFLIKWRLEKEYGLRALLFSYRSRRRAKNRTTNYTMRSMISTPTRCRHAQRLMRCTDSKICRRAFRPERAFTLQ